MGDAKEDWLIKKRLAERRRKAGIKSDPEPTNVDFCKVLKLNKWFSSKSSIMRFIACKYAGAAKNWLQSGILKKPRLISGRQFEIESEDDVLVSGPSNDLLIDENKNLLLKPINMNPSMITHDGLTRYEEVPAPGHGEKDKEIPPVPENSSGKHKPENTEYKKNKLVDNRPFLSRKIYYNSEQMPNLYNSRLLNFLIRLEIRKQIIDCDSRIPATPI